MFQFTKKSIIASSLSLGLLPAFIGGCSTSNKNGSEEDNSTGLLTAFLNNGSLGCPQIQWAYTGSSPVIDSCNSGDSVNFAPGLFNNIPSNQTVVGICTTIVGFTHPWTGGPKADRVGIQSAILQDCASGAQVSTFNYPASLNDAIGIAIALNGFIPCEQDTPVDVDISCQIGDKVVGTFKQSVQCGLCVP